MYKARMVLALQLLLFFIGSIELEVNLKYLQALLNKFFLSLFYRHEKVQYLSGLPSGTCVAGKQTSWSASSLQQTPF